jgi:Cu-processing system permease protein
MKNSLVLAKVFLLELIREKLLFVGLVLAIALSLLGMALGNLSFDESNRIIFHLSIAALHLVSIGLAVIFGSTALMKEVERQTCLMVLVRPVSRIQFYLGKFAAVAILIGLFQMTVSVVIAFLLGSSFQIQSYSMILAGIFLEVLIVLATAFLASMIVRPSLAVFSGIGIFLIGNWIPEFEFFAGKSDSPVFRALGSSIRWWFPNLFRLNWRSYSILSESIPVEQLSSAILHGLSWLGLLLVFGIFFWKRRDLV